LNFAPVTLVAPAGVDVRQVDLSVELQVLAFLGEQRVLDATGATAADVRAIGHVVGRSGA
jgi:redox-sensing transcriptional repressor